MRFLVAGEEQPFSPSGYSNSLAELKGNLELWRPILKAAATTVILPEGFGGTSFSAYVGLVDAAALIGVMEEMRYLDQYKDASVIPRTAFYRQLLDDALLDDFLLILPQPEVGSAEIADVGHRAIISRDRRIGRGGKFGEITDKKHRLPAEVFVDGLPPDALATFQSPKTGAALVYLAREDEPSYGEPKAGSPPVGEPERGVVVAFSSYVPKHLLEGDSTIPKFRVRDPSKEDATTIDVFE